MHQLHLLSTRKFAQQIHTKPGFLHIIAMTTGPTLIPSSVTFVFESHSIKSRGQSAEETNSESAERMQCTSTGMPG